MPAELRLSRDEALSAAMVGPVEALLLAHRAELLAFARARTPSPADAEDVVQQVALRALRHAATLRDPASGRAWLFRIARNVLIDRGEVRRVELASSDEVLERELAADGDDAARVCGCVLVHARELKPEYAEVLEQVVVRELPIARAAVALGITPNNAMVRLHRARAALRRRLAERCGTRSARACADCGCDA